VPRLRLLLLACIACGLGLGALAAALQGWLADRDWQLGLARLAADRASRAVATQALAGAAGFALAAPLAAVAARVAPSRLGIARLAVFGAAALPPAAWFAWEQRWALAERAAARPIGAVAGALIAACLAGLLAALSTRAAGPRAARRLGLVSLALAALTASLGVWARAPRPGAGQHPDVLIVVLDTVRADRLSVDGYARPTSPELEALAREAVRFPRFYSTSSWTLPGHASLFTGLLPMQHGATQEHLRLERRFATLAEVLRDAGYRTWGASANPVVGPVSGLDQGFERFEEVWRPAPAAAQGHPVNEAFDAFLARVGSERPYFAFVNYMEAHRPYRPPPELLRRFARQPASALRAQRVGERPWYAYYLEAPPPAADVALLSDLYDASLAAVSARVGELIGALRRAGRLERTLVIVTSDHGENLGEHGHFDHVFSLYETTLRVPLLVRLPDGPRAGTVDPRPGQLADLPATVLRVCGVEPPRAPLSRVDLLSPEPGDARREIVAEYYHPAQAIAMIRSALGPEAAASERLRPYLRRLRAVQADGRKLIWASDGRHELYDLRDDPGETRDRAGEQGFEATAGALAARLESTLDRLAAPASKRPPRAIAGFGAEGRVDDETNEALRALGYAR
jgi:arylsulfatase A-like enzyme